MRVLNPEQQKLLSDKLMDLGNYTGPGIIVGLIIAGRGNWVAYVSGVVVTIVFYLVALYLRR